MTESPIYRFMTTQCRKVKKDNNKITTPPDQAQATGRDELTGGEGNALASHINDPSSHILPSQPDGKGFSEMEPLPSSSPWSALALAVKDGRRVVLKGLKGTMRGRSPYEEMLRGEFRCMMDLNHPNVVTAYGWEDDAPGMGHCIVMEHVDGRTLSDFLEKEKPSLSERRKIARQLIGALTYIHKKGIAHADIKPQNILITWEGNNVKLIDFGLARAEADILKLAAGTDGYMAPEVEAEGVVDATTDLYSLGKVLTELHIGRNADWLAERYLCVERSRRCCSVEQALKLLRRHSRIRFWIKSVSIAAIIAIVATGAWYGVKAYEERQWRKTEYICKPYIGPGYKKGGEMLLYWQNDVRNTATISGDEFIVGDYLRLPMKVNHLTYFADLESIILGKKITDKNRGEWFRQAVFKNLIPWPRGEVNATEVTYNETISPLAAQMREEFYFTLRQLQPHIVWVAGLDTWQNLPQKYIGETIAVSIGKVRSSYTSYSLPGMDESIYVVYVGDPSTLVTDIGEWQLYVAHVRAILSKSLNGKAHAAASSVE